MLVCKKSVVGLKHLALNKFIMVTLQRQCLKSEPLVLKKS